MINSDWFLWLYRLLNSLKKRKGVRLMLRKLCISLLVVVCFFSTPSYAKELMVNVGIAMDQTGPLATSGRKGVSSWQWFEEYLNKEVGGWKDVAGNTVKLKVLYG